jgi:phage repressor protein C with HTH and peptisase S24 domain
MRKPLKVKEIREKLNLTQQELADKTGIPKDRIAKWEQGKGSPKVEDSLILQGLLEEDVPREPFLVQDPGDPPYHIKRREAKNSAGVFMVPVVPAKAQAGYARSYEDVTFLNQLEMRPIFPGVDHRGAIWRYFEVQGDSMEPALFERDLVLVRMVPPEDWEGLKNKQVYVIVTDKDVMVKIVNRKDRDTWILTSSNPRHKQRTIQVKDVKEVWLYWRMLRGGLPLP